MSSPQSIEQYAAWLLSTSRLDSTVQLRLRHIRSLGATHDLTTVTTRELEAVLARSRHKASETRKSMLASWRLFFRWAQARGLREDDPAALVESVRVTVRVPRVAPDDAIAGALESATLPQRAMILLARYGCLRLSELTKAHARNRDGETLRVIGKGDKERIVYLNDDLQSLLATLEREQGHGFYFPGIDRPHMHPQSVHKIIRRVTGWNPHSLRHAGATAAYRATGDLRAVQEMLGHASLATTQRYLHLNENAMRAVAAGTLIPMRRAA